MTTLFKRETVYVSEKNSPEDVFEEVYLDLLKQGLVTVDFLASLLEREHNYPTGLDLTPIDRQLPNIAIPHTESEYVRTTRVIPIKLKTPLIFHNMIAPDDQLTVCFLFMILNENGVEQAGVLADIMDFINRTEKQALLSFFSSENPEEIYQFLENNFKGEK
ncbi:PTS sugar transporter subunit IIA [Enterococcus pallens]|uniref:PTS system IIA component n=1 Tax=Enterococcus pallens ATCC BAA-351 TaxID=1158607 RepID=R2SXX1_9ENTE|nr:PTS sugar transporter subunit IIA [Enterococcus pallens]EOH97626.1 PTS system IIA component [Enterococcus pallens ATCC BAA-351]EOU20955.1 PTS system IIA component [Enterococcus pallens ATCC BAA-351]OJG80166.1 PTS system IIA component [Enterococcus pallens]